MNSETFDHLHPNSTSELRSWLEKNVDNANYPVWIIIYKKNSGLQTVSYEQVVEEAICFGLIDTQTKSVSEKTYGVCLRKRGPKSNWTAANRKIAEDMIDKKKMTTEGLKIYKSRALI